MSCLTELQFITPGASALYSGCVVNMRANRCHSRHAGDLTRHEIARFTSVPEAALQSAPQRIRKVFFSDISHSHIPLAHIVIFVTFVTPKHTRGSSIDLMCEPRPPPVVKDTDKAQPTVKSVV